MTYPPLDTPKPVTEEVWIVDSGPLAMMGMRLPLRMVVIRLPSGELLLHSPTRFTPDLARALEGLGPIRFLAAPSFAHWIHVAEWQRNTPGTITCAAPGLRERRQVRKAGLQIDRVLDGTPPPEWGDAIKLVTVPGGAGFRETAFFHAPSRTLVLTDLVLNLEAEKLPPMMVPFARLVGITAPDGRAPAYLRALIKLRRQDAAKAAQALLDLRPERVIFAHGKWFDHDAAAALRRSLSWLVS